MLFQGLASPRDNHVSRAHPGLAHWTLIFMPLWECRHLGGARSIYQPSTINANVSADISGEMGRWGRTGPSGLEISPIVPS